MDPIWSNMTQRCTFRDPSSGRTIASGTANAANGSEVVSRNAALAKAASDVDFDAYPEGVILDCDGV